MTGWQTELLEQVYEALGDRIDRQMNVAAVYDELVRLNAGDDAKLVAVSDELLADYDDLGFYAPHRP